jgi:hypothetical protein
MVDKIQNETPFMGEGLPFPEEWVKKQPRKVEEVLSSMSIEGQVRCILGLNPFLQQQILVLSEKALEVTQSLPVEEVYNLIKEVGKEDSLLIISMVSPDQLQYIFDVEWWQGDKFQPKQALDWIVLLDQCQDPEIMEWFLSEDFDQKVVLFQAFFKVFKKDEMTDSYEGVEGLEHYTPDGVYDIFFKVENSKEIRKLLLLLHEKEQNLLYNLLEAVIWYPVTITVERAYQWRVNRTGERGIPEFQEAIGIYSHLDAETLKLKLPSLEEIPSSRFKLSPRYPLAHLDETLFFSQCLAVLENESRLETLRWELVCLANKVIVADGYDLSSKGVRQQALRKTLGYINMGLEIGAAGDLKKGVSLLGQVWMQSLYQVGYEQLRQIRSAASAFINENGSYIKYFISEVDKERLGALVFRFPQVAEKVQDSFNWRDLKSMKDVEVVNEFLARWKFYSRFSRQGLGLSESIFLSLQDESDDSDACEPTSLLTLVSTALAHYVLFKQLSCDPLAEVAVKSFLEMIFLPGIFKDEAKSCNEDLLNAFEQELLRAPMAWTDSDKKYLQDLLLESAKNLEVQFGSLDLTCSIDWEFTQGLSTTRRGASE